GATAHSFGRDHCHASRILKTLLAGAGVGVAGANHDPPSIGSWYALTGDLNGRGRHAVLCEHAGRGTWRVANDQSQIAPARIRFDARMNSGEAIAASQNHVVHTKRP